MVPAMVVVIDLNETQFVRVPRCDLLEKSVSQSIRLGLFQYIRHQGDTGREIADAEDHGVPPPFDQHRHLHHVHGMIDLCGGSEHLRSDRIADK